MVTIIQRLTFDSALALAIFALAMGVANLLVLFCKRAGGDFAEAVSPKPNKRASLEGLRGVLALSVAAHHAYCWFFFMHDGIWRPGQSVIFARLAIFGVIQFFYISGYLFWRKLMKQGSIPTGSFYLSRFIRIAPVYYISVGTAILTGVLIFGSTLHVSIYTLIRSLMPWLFFSIGGEPPINGIDVKRIISGVVWTLAIEWLFYLSLPLLGWFSRKRYRLLHLAGMFATLLLISRFLSSGRIHQELAVGVLWTITTFSKLMLIGFGGGILVAAFEEEIRDRLTLSRTQRNWLLLCLYAIYLIVPGIAISGQIFLLAGFVLVVSGTDLFGLITTKSIRLLGIISYDLYLVHGWVYFTAIQMRGGIHPTKLNMYMLQTAVCIVGIVVISTLLHFAVERPSMRISEEISRTDRDKRTVVLPAAVLDTALPEN